MSHTIHSTPIAPTQVHEILGRHMLADGYDMVLDLDKSQGRRLWDARSGRWILDMFSFSPPCRWG
jgi:L-lysine 6-transaminase precursor (EC 2.6.1.36)